MALIVKDVRSHMGRFVTAACMRGTRLLEHLAAMCWKQLRLAVTKLHVNNKCAIIPSCLDMTCARSETRCISLLERLPACVRYCTLDVLLDWKRLVHVWC